MHSAYSPKRLNGFLLVAWLHKAARTRDPVTSLPRKCLVGYRKSNAERTMNRADGRRGRGLESHKRRIDDGGEFNLKIRR